MKFIKIIPSEGLRCSQQGPQDAVISLWPFHVQWAFRLRGPFNSCKRTTRRVKEACKILSVCSVQRWWEKTSIMALLKLQILAVWLRTCTLPWQVRATLFAEVPREASFGHSSTVLSAVLSARDSLCHKKLHRQNNPSIVAHPLKMEIWGRETLKSDLLKLYRKSVVGP